MRAVLDSNIIVSALNFAGREREVLELGRSGAFELCVSPFILEEVAGVLTRKFGWDNATAERAMRLIASRAEAVDPEEHVSVVRRNDADNRILECAMAARADFLVTGDRRDLLPLGEYQGVRIVTSAQFLAALVEEPHA